MANSIRLTSEQEQFFLNLILHNEDEKVKRIGCGSSRIVFSFNKYEFLDKLREMGFSAKTSSVMVIKVAIGKGGIRQMNLEVSNFLDYGDEYPLGKIYAYGRYIEIMEKIETCPRYIACGQARHEEYWDVVSKLECINGETADNDQVGENEDGFFVAYDYGFTNEGKEEGTGGVGYYCSDISDTVECDDAALEEYLEALYDSLTIEVKAFDDIETHIHGIEKDIKLNYGGEDNYDDEKSDEDVGFEVYFPDTVEADTIYFSINQEDDARECFENVVKEGTKRCIFRYINYTTDYEEIIDEFEPEEPQSDEGDQPTNSQN